MVFSYLIGGEQHQPPSAVLPSFDPWIAEEEVFLNDGKVAISDSGGQTSNYDGFAFSIPLRARILGIEARIDAFRTPICSAPRPATISVRLSANNGLTYSSAKTTGTLTTTEQTFILGGGSDLWGIAWTPTIINTLLAARIVSNFPIFGIACPFGFGWENYAEYLEVKVYYLNPDGSIEFQTTTGRRKNGINF